MSVSKCLSSKRRLFRRWRSDQRGYVTIEALIAFPFVFILFAAAWVFFDAFRQQSINQKANYTIGDMISRETMAIDDTYINSVQRMFYILTRTWGTNDSQIRISMVHYDADDDEYTIEWSESRGTQAALTTSTLQANYLTRLPVVAHNDRLILVETWDKLSPVFGIGLDKMDITTYSFTRPRYTPDIVHTNSPNDDNWDPKTYEPQIPTGGGVGKSAEEWEEIFAAEEKAAEEAAAAAAAAAEAAANNTGSSNTGNGGNSGSSGSSSSGSSGSSGSTTTTTTYTPPPSPPPPPPTPPSQRL
jgi:uncharacterized membrane protein YgcG